MEITAQPIVGNGRVYLGLMDGRVLAFDATSGTLVWTTTVGGAVPNTLNLPNLQSQAIYKGG